ncbi:MAG TPA: LysR family transcriptional regulator [Bryobacteraceae bacterium]|nr:LysR family transcriptional regulator [Bryobacteraceae bacterium]
MELRHLRYFVALAEELHFGRAAERLHIAQPALSQQIRRLEEELGVSLLQRTKRRVRLTAPGAAFLEPARSTLAHAHEAARAAQLASRGDTGSLVMGFVTSALYGVFPDIIRVFRERYRDVRLTLHELPIVQQMEWLRNGRIQVSFLRPPVDDHDLHVRTISKESWVVALPESHALAQRSRVPLRALSEDQFILFPRELAPSLYDQLLGVYLKAGFSPHVALEAQMQAIVSLVAAGVGVALVPSSLQNLRRKGLVYRPLQGAFPKVELAVAWRRDDLSPVLERFLKVVREVTGRR